MTKVIAEAGINHGGSDTLAHRLIEAAKEAGADVCKFQMFRTNALIRRRGIQAGFLSQYEFGMRAWKEIKAHCEDIGLEFLCSVFDELSADDYFSLKPTAVKIGSGELHDLDLIRHVAAQRLPMILSTGMASMPEIAQAVKILHQDVTLLHCVSAYPAPIDEVNLRAMDALRAFGYPVGYSDHTLSHAVCLAAVARGASVIEQHLTLDKTLPGPDHAASATPQEFATLVSGIRQLEQVLGDGVKRVMPAEEATRAYCRGGLHASGPKTRDGMACVLCGADFPPGTVSVRKFCGRCRDKRDRASILASKRRQRAAGKP